MSDATTDVPDRIFFPMADLPPLRDLAADAAGRTARAKSLIYTGSITTEGLRQAKLDLLGAATSALALLAELERLTAHD